MRAGSMSSRPRRKARAARAVAREVGDGGGVVVARAAADAAVVVAQHGQPARASASAMSAKGLMVSAWQRLVAVLGAAAAHEHDGRDAARCRRAGTACPRVARPRTTREAPPRPRCTASRRGVGDGTGGDAYASTAGRNTDSRSEAISSARDSSRTRYAGRRLGQAEVGDGTRCLVASETASSRALHACFASRVARVP